MHDIDIVQVPYNYNPHPVILREIEDDELSDKLTSVSLLMAQEQGKKALETIQQQHKGALDIIKPGSQQHALCEIRVMVVIDEIREKKALEKRYHRQLLQAPKKKRALVKAYRAIEEVAADTAAVETGLGNERLLLQIKEERRFLERFFEKVTRGGIKKSIAKKIATINAWLLLAFCGGRRPTLTKDGDWHQLAAILYGYENAHSFDFNYLRCSGLPTRKNWPSRREEIQAILYGHVKTHSFDLVRGSLDEIEVQIEQSD
jgi:hypothetical protein